MGVHNDIGEDASASISRRTRARWIAFLALLFLAGVLNSYVGGLGWPYVSFSSNRLRILAGLIILSIPWLVFSPDSNVASIQTRVDTCFCVDNSRFNNAGDNPYRPFCLALNF